jgi:hypothetical protein
MSRLRGYRTGSNLNGSGRTEFYFKVENDSGKLIGTFLVDENGLYFYKPKSFILTPNENEDTLCSYNGFISFKDLAKIMDGLNANDDKQLKIKCNKSMVSIHICDNPK